MYGLAERYRCGDPFQEGGWLRSRWVATPPLLNITLVVTRYSSFLDFIALFRLYTYYLLLSLPEEC